MKILKKLGIFLLLGFFTLISFNLSVNAENLVLSDGTTVYYKGTTIAVEVPEDYKMQDTYFRGVWVTPLAGCLPSCSSSSEANYRKEILEMFDVMEYYGLNALIYHIRIMNDALYPSKLNPKSNYMTTNTDMLEWVIEECHNRGIEFHAWMNPYRVKSSGGSDLNAIANNIKNKCPNNIGSNPDNLLMNSSGGFILNPGLPEVRDFIVETCMEVIKNYDVDAIHFDDYFYITGVDDTSTREKYNPDGLSLADWRRHQVDLFIKQLSDEMRAYNEENNRYVQLGISPSGIYRNGDGVVTYDENGNAITNGSKTGGMQHYDNYLYSDTLKWCNEEWIDYIVPQSYWGFSHTVAGFADVMGWWNKVVAKKKVNLYSGMGIYMSETPGKNYSWGFDPNEAYNQILYTTTLTNTSGTVFYNYNYLERAYKGDETSLYGQGLKKIKAEMFTNPAILPVIRTMGEVKIDAVKSVKTEVKDNDTLIQFNEVPNAKRYVIYRSLKNVTCAPEEVVAIVSQKPYISSNVISFLDEGTNGNKYNYAVRAQAANNQLSEPTYGGLVTYEVTFTDFDGNVLKKETVPFGGSATAPTPPVRSEGEFLGWGADFSTVTSDLVVNAKYTDSKCIVKFYNGDGSLAKEEIVFYGKDAIAPVVTKEGYNFVGWDKEFSNVTKDLEVYPIFEEKMITYKFVTDKGVVIDEYQLKFGKIPWYPADPTKDGYTFVGWDKEIDGVTEDIVVTALFEPIMLTITFVSDIDDSVIDVIQIPMYSNVPLPESAPEVPGHIFKQWRGNTQNVNYNATITAVYEEIEYLLTFLDIDGNVLVEIEHYYVDPFTYPEAPAVEGYKFIGWSFDVKDLDNINTEVTIYPIYYKDGATVTFVDKDGNVIDTVIVKDEAISAPNAPVFENYTFVGWDKEFTTVKDDLTVTALYEQFKVKFVDMSGNVLFEDFLTDGSYKKAFPEVLVVGYILKSWNIDTIENQYQDVTVTGIFEEKTITVTYLDKDGNVIDEEVVPYGGNALNEVSAPTVDGMKFNGWDKPLEQLTEDLTVTATYIESTGCSLFTLKNMFVGLALLGFAILMKKKK